MRKTIFASCALAIAVLLSAASCDLSPAEYELYACDSWATTLDKAAELREQQKLSTTQISVVQKTKDVLDPICLAPPPNIEQSALNTVVDAGVRSIAGIVKIFLPNFDPKKIE